MSSRFNIEQSEYLLSVGMFHSRLHSFDPELDLNSSSPAFLPVFLSIFYNRSLECEFLISEKAVALLNSICYLGATEGFFSHL